MKPMLTRLMQGDRRRPPSWRAALLDDFSLLVLVAGVALLVARSWVAILVIGAIALGTGAFRLPLYLRLHRER